MGWTGKAWTFKSGSTGLFLAVNGTAADGTKLVPSATPFEWHIWRADNDPNTFRCVTFLRTMRPLHSFIDVAFRRIFVPFTHQNLDLFNQGDPTPGTLITTWWTWEGVHQTWKFTQV